MERIATKNTKLKYAKYPLITLVMYLIFLKRSKPPTDQVCTSGTCKMHKN